ncbi:hypothetical protein C1646_768436 [Rhizophagus diaphanus]|nr:hypothetical protein C1646_768436 [Rhizophagus diaphanus] [Rhizophagus sp. MUCL 43196]
MGQDIFVLDTFSLYAEKPLPPATRGRSLTAPTSPTKTCTSTRSSTPVQPMQVDDDFNDKIYNKHDGKSHDRHYLTVEQFNYSMNLLDIKINNEYHVALEKYLTEHTGHYIKEIGKNGWISLFKDKLLPEELFNNKTNKITSWIMEELAEQEKQNNPDVTSNTDESMVVTVDDDDDNTDAYTKMVRGNLMTE